LKAAAGARSGKVTLCRTRGIGGLSTIIEEIGKNYYEMGDAAWPLEVPMVRLSETLDEHAINSIDILKIDAEGAEFDVLTGIELTRHRPRIAVIEAIDPITHDCVRDAWEAPLCRAGLRFVHFDGINAFYSTEEFAHLIRAPIDENSIMKLSDFGNALQNPEHPAHNFAIVLGARLIRAVAAGEISIERVAARDMNHDDIQNAPTAYFVSMAHQLVLGRRPSPSEMLKYVSAQFPSGAALIVRLSRTSEFLRNLGLAAA